MLTYYAAYSEIHVDYLLICNPNYNLFLLYTELIYEVEVQLGDLFHKL